MSSLKIEMNLHNSSALEGAEEEGYSQDFGPLCREFHVRSFIKEVSFTNKL